MAFEDEKMDHSKTKMRRIDLLKMTTKRMIAVDELLARIRGRLQRSDPKNSLPLIRIVKKT